MALVVEDGSGLSNAESYISVADATTYLTEIGEEADWTAAQVAAQEAALRLSTSWIDGRYSWPGFPKNDAQALDWPRFDAFDCEGRLVDSGSVPEGVRRACAWVAKESVAGSVDLTGVNTDGRIKRTRDKVGDLETEVEYEPGGAPGGEIVLPFADSLLSCLYESITRGSSGWSVSKLVRA